MIQRCNHQVKDLRLRFQERKRTYGPRLQDKPIKTTCDTGGASSTGSDSAPFPCFAHMLSMMLVQDDKLHRHDVGRNFLLRIAATIDGTL